MRRAVLCAFVIVVAAGAEAAKDDAKRIEGSYVLAGGERDGKKLSKMIRKGASLVIRGDHHKVHVGDEVLDGTHKLDPSKQPKTIDATDTDGPFKGQTVHGIYE